MGGSLAGTVRISSIVRSETDPARSDGFSLLRLMSEPGDTVPIDGTTSAAESAEDSLQSIVKVPKVRVLILVLLLFWTLKLQNS